MKIKIDYVTNSSSASYLLYIESEFESLENFKDVFERYMDDYLKYDYHDIPPRFYNPKDITKFSSNTFLITDWTSMHNDFHDIPQYMHDLIFTLLTDEKHLRSEYGFKGFKFKVEEDG